MCGGAGGGAPSNKEFKKGKLSDIFFDFKGDCVIKFYGTNKVWVTMVANPGYGLIDVVTEADLAYVVAVIEDKKGVWKEEVNLKDVTRRT